MLIKHGIDQAFLHKHLDYDPKEGHLIWKVPLSKKNVRNTRAGSLVSTTGYRSIFLNGKSFPEHHIVWCWCYGYFPENNEEIDHINQIRSDNRSINLRKVTKAENSRNRKKNPNSRTNEVGIWYNRNTKRYVAEITMTIEGKKRKVFQKSFINIEDAIRERKAEAIKLGFHENHGS